MAENKTRATAQDVDAFLARVEPEQRRRDCQALCRLFSELTGAPPVMWGDSIVGFGQYHYVYASGRKGDWFPVGFSPRKNDLTLYLLPDLDELDAQRGRLGKHKTGKCCLYVKNLADIQLEVLAEMVRINLQRLAAMS